ncbi:hypothetical protein DM01DRAFT_1386494 [Hesseltinella vesiculosa]|uniref:Helicase SWR1 n=1 Tax=Hesseltinella vesiculosa TaxID=101127 RepID=A0A1X2G5N5_9FUNG|nr:hypothetical protein DM01DRAFT_1386494 [Hesseltinella vesiculosa]
MNESDQEKDVTNSAPMALVPPTINPENTTVPATRTPLQMQVDDSQFESDPTSTTGSGSSTNEDRQRKRAKQTKRGIRIQEKLKSIKVRSLFDTDGDINRHNIISSDAGNGRSARVKRKRNLDDYAVGPVASSAERHSISRKKNTVPESSRASSSRSADPPKRGRKPAKAQQAITAETPESMIELRQMSALLLRPPPKTPLDATRNQAIRDRELKMQALQNHRDAVVSELANLEVYQTLVDYRPDVFNADERVIKYISSYNLWDLANSYLMEKYKQGERSIKLKKLHKDQPLPLIQMLQHASELDTLLATQATSSSSVAADGTASSTIPNKMLLQRLPPAATLSVSSGTGIRRFHRQFPTLHSYLDTFNALDDVDDATPEDIQAYIDNERTVRERIEQFENLGGFTTQLQKQADQRPHFEPSRRTTDERVHDSIISQYMVAAKNFSKHSKYRVNAARRCAKAVDKYWDNIRTREERVQRLEIKRLTKLAKWTAQQVRHKWKVVERICEARYKELLKEQQAQESRRHLELILEHSEQVLGARKDELGTLQDRMDVDQDQENTLLPLMSTDASTSLSSPEALDDWYSMTEEDGRTTTDADSMLDEEDVMEDHFDEEDELDHVIDDAAESDEEDDEDDNDLTVEQLMAKYGYGQALSSPNDSADQKPNTTSHQPPLASKTSGQFDRDAPSPAASKLSTLLQTEPLDEQESDDAFSTSSPSNDDLISDAATTDDEETAQALTAEASLPLNVLYTQYMSSGKSEMEQIKPPTRIEPDDEDISEEPLTKRRKVARLESPVRTPSDIYTHGTTVQPVLSAAVPSVEEEDDDERTVTDDESDGEPGEPKTAALVPVSQSRPVPSTPAESPTADARQLPTGTTLSTTKVNTRIPFLLRGTLREYQHVGLDWLMSLYNHGLNGILADEMGLGKTIQTIALLASLACDKGIWGPHLVVVPTSVILNWEMEFKRWLPGFKILTYYGTPKERKEKRMGWSKPNAFHVCITSYQLVLHDQSAFRRKAWQYLILDEAHNIKNFRSQRWQVLLNFNAQRRLLLTGTPLQNSLVELWSLLYFLMPNGVSSDMPIGFANLKEFQEWFANPVDMMLEHQDASHQEESRLAIQKLHTVLRPYLLRRLKADVEQQMPAKYEHVMYCRLSKRQRYLYDDFMGRAKTKETLASGNFLSIINTLMQLRKVCNHPDLFEERPIVTSFTMAPELQEHTQQLSQWTRSKFFYDDRQDVLDALNLLIVRPAMEMTWTRSTALEVRDLDASPALLSHPLQPMHTGRSLHSMKKKFLDLDVYGKWHAWQQQQDQHDRWAALGRINQLRCARQPVYGADLLTTCQDLFATPHHELLFPSVNDPATYMDRSDSLRRCVLGYEDRLACSLDTIERYAFVTPAAVVQAIHGVPVCSELMDQNDSHADMFAKDILHPIDTRLRIAFPDKRLLQYDCGKLQRLALLLQDLAAGGHRALIFTQMTRVLDILEAFLNMHGYRYLRLDGATKVEKRQLLTERFNSDPRITCFILSTRSGGLGINLTGADTVIFYDSDWNPSMDKQCQDRAHRIGQVRDVHIYRFVTQFTVEENIFKKANQKRMLDNMVIHEGGFTNDYFQKMDWWRDLPEVTGHAAEQQLSNKDLEQALLDAEEDEQDAQAAIEARKELTLDDNEFTETASNVATPSKLTPTPTPVSPSMSPSSHGSAQSPVIHPSLAGSTKMVPPHLKKSRHHDRPSQTPEMDHEAMAAEQEAMDLDEEVGHVDQYMLRFWEREIFGHYLGFGGLPEPQTS